MNVYLSAAAKRLDCGNTIDAYQMESHLTIQYNAKRYIKCQIKCYW